MLDFAREIFGSGNLFKISQEVFWPALFDAVLSEYKERLSEDFLATTGIQEEDVGRCKIIQSLFSDIVLASVASI